MSPGWRMLFRFPDRLVFGSLHSVTKFAGSFYLKKILGLLADLPRRILRSESLLKRSCLFHVVRSPQFNPCIFQFLDQSHRSMQSCQLLAGYHSKFLYRQWSCHCSSKPVFLIRASYHFPTFRRIHPLEKSRLPIHDVHSAPRTLYSGCFHLSRNTISLALPSSHFASFPDKPTQLILVRQVQRSSRIHGKCHDRKFPCRHWAGQEHPCSRSSRLPPHGACRFPSFHGRNPRFHTRMSPAPTSWLLCTRLSIVPL